MAGGVLKGFGGVFLTLGILLLLAGAGAAGYSAYDQDQNQDQSGPFGVGEDRERSDQNELLLYAGIAAAGLGLVLLIIGIVLLATGGSRARRAELRALSTGLARPEPDSGGVAAGAPVATSSAAGPSTTPQLASPAATRMPGRGKPVAVALVVPLALFAVVGVAVLVGSSGGGKLLGFSDDDAPPEEQGLLGEVHESGHMAESVSVLGMGQSRETSAVPFTTSEGTGRVVIQANWTTADVGGSERLQVYLEIEEDGVWTLLAENTGPSGVQVEFADESARLSSASMRVRVFPGDDGASAGQDFAFTARFFR